MQEYLKSLNPQKDEQQILFYGRRYKLFRDEKYIGVATWTKDENIGDSFQNVKLDTESGHYINEVFLADKWDLIIKN